MKLLNASLEPVAEFSLDSSPISACWSKKQGLLFLGLSTGIAGGLRLYPSLVRPDSVVVPPLSFGNATLPAAAAASAVDAEEGAGGRSEQQVKFYFDMLSESEWMPFANISCL